MVYFTGILIGAFFSLKPALLCMFEPVGLLGPGFEDDWSVGLWDIKFVLS